MEPSFLRVPEVNNGKSNRGLTLDFQLLLVTEGSISYLCSHEEDALAHCGLKLGSSFFLNKAPPDHGYRLYL